MKNIETSRNTEEQLNWYIKRAKFISSLSQIDIANNSSVFSTRQQVTRFIETLRYWEMVKDVPGNIIECGVAGGNFLFSMAHLSSIYEPHHYTRKVIGFDTFEGFIEPTEKDLSSKASHMKSGGLCYESYDYLLKAIELFDQNRMIGNIPKISLYKGDICETFPKYIDNSPACVIALLHLDLDLYKPTKEVLDRALDRMPKGGIIIFDELNHDDYPGETIAVFESLGIRNIRLSRVPEASMAAFMRIE
jgi:hypothetical protein